MRYADDHFHFIVAFLYSSEILQISVILSVCYERVEMLIVMDALALMGCYGIAFVVVLVKKICVALCLTATN